MAKVIKYGDTSGIESDFEQAPVGLYVLLAEEVSERKSNNGEQMVEVVFRPTHDANQKKLKKKYSRLWFYAPLDPEASWARRLKELVAAFGLKAKGGNLALIEGKSCLGRLREDTDLDGEYRPNIGKLMPMPADADEPDEDDEDEGAEDGALDGLSRAELKKIIKDEGLEISVKKSMSDEDIAEAITEAREEAEDEDDEEDDEEPEDEADEDDDEEDDDEDEEDDEQEDNYEEMTIKELRQELEDRELETKGARKVLIARLRTDDVSEPV